MEVSTRYPAFARFSREVLYQPGQVYRVAFGHRRGMKIRYFPDLQFVQMFGTGDMLLFSLVERITRALRAHKPIRNVCDLGAHVGIFSLAFTRMFPRATIFAFEPNPEIVVRFRDHLRLNRLSTVHVVAKACVDRKRKVELRIDADSRYSTLLRTHCVRRVAVPGVSLDEFFFGPDSVGLPDFIKIDIQGTADLALAGADRCIAEGRPLIYVGLHNRAEENAVATLLRDHKYRAYRTDRERWLSARAKIGTTSSLFLVPNELVPRVSAALSA